MADLESTSYGSGDQRLIYECRMSYQYHIHVPDGCGDTRYSHSEYRERYWHVVAASQALAEAAWHKEYGWPDSKMTLISCIPILTIDRELTIR